MSELYEILIMLFAFVVILWVVEYLHQKAHIIAEVSRKITHISVGLLCIYVPIDFRNQWFILGSSALFILFLYFSKKKNWLKSLHNIERQSFGVYLIPVSIVFIFLVYQFYDYNKLFYLPLVILTISDPLASFAGLLWKSHLKKNGKKRTRKYSKTTIGSVTFFVATFVSSFLFFKSYQSIAFFHVLYLCLAISVLTTLIEAISYKGWDNLNIPVTVVAVLVVYVEFIR